MRLWAMCGGSGFFFGGRPGPTLLVWFVFVSAHTLVSSSLVKYAACV